MKKIVSVLLTTLALYPGPLQAAEPAGQSVIVTMMDEVVVTATKTEEKRSAIVNAVIIKDSADIAEAPVESVGSLLANEPGVDWRTRGNYGGAAEEIRIRGMGAEGTLVVVDGVVLNSPSLGSADVGQIPLNSIERVEVVKGPGSLLYGSGAMGGTVNIINKKPKREGYTAKVEAGYGTESTYHLAAESGGFVAGDFGYYLTANRKETDGFRDNSDLEHNDISLNLLYDKGEPLEVNFNFGFVDREYGLPGVQPPVGIAPFFSSATGLPLYNSDSATLQDRGEDENRHSSLELKGRAADWLGWRVKGDCAVLDGFNKSQAYNPVTFAYDGSSTQTEVTNTSRGVEGNLDLRLFSRLGLLLGSEYRNFDYENEQQGFDPFGIQTSGMSDENRVFTQGTFAEMSLTPVEQIKLTAGYRYETNSLFGHENVARYGMVVKPLPTTVLKVNHGKHFKAPTMNDLFWPDDGFFTKGNRNLKPETGWHSDVTVEQEMLHGNIFATLSWFKWDIADKIAWAADPAQPSPSGFGFYWTPSNINTYKTEGWEAALRVRPYDALVTDLSLTLLDAEEELEPGKPRLARYSPELTFKAGLTHYADFGLTSSLVARYIGSRPYYYTDSVSGGEVRIELDSYWTVDLKLEQELARNWHLGLLATNLFDEEYATYLNGFTNQNTFEYTQQPYPGAGRSLFASVSYKW
jgi:outer membrane cobalamin receptor